MQNPTKLYEAFGELIYVIAMSDGQIQPEELQAIEQRLAGHPWGQDIKWSFEYEVAKKQPIEDLYKKVISYCEMHGPEKEYQFLIETLEAVAAASQGIATEEQAVIDNFSSDLIRKFKEDIERINA